MTLPSLLVVAVTLVFLVLERLAPGGQGCTAQYPVDPNRARLEPLVERCQPQQLVAVEASSGRQASGDLLAGDQYVDRLRPGLLRWLGWQRLERRPVGGDRRARVEWCPVAQHLATGGKGIGALGRGGPRWCLGRAAETEVEAGRLDARPRLLDPPGRVVTEEPRRGGRPPSGQHDARRGDVAALRLDDPRRSIGPHGADRSAVVDGGVAV